MSHIHYEEEQRFTNLRWIWVAISAVFIFMILIFTMDPELKGKTTELLITFGASIIPIGILLISRLQLKVDSDGLHYKFFPSVPRWRHISGSVIETFEVVDKNSFYEKFACGYRRNRLTNSIFMNITGSKFIRLQLNNGRKLKIGSTNAEAVERALKRLVNKE